MVAGNILTYNRFYKLTSSGVVRPDTEAVNDDDTVVSQTGSRTVLIPNVHSLLSGNSRRGPRPSGAVVLYRFVYYTQKNKLCTSHRCA